MFGAESEALPVHAIMRLARHLTLCLLLFCVPALQAKTRHQEVVIAEPYIELHTGPGAGYPVFDVVERGELVTLLKRKTNWFKVSTARGHEGWVSIDALEQTLSPAGESIVVKRETREDFSARRWELGMMGGDFGGTSVLTYYGSYAFNPLLAIEGSVSQSLGEFSTSLLFNADLIAQPFPEWWVSPYFALGTGYITTEAKSTLVAPADSGDQLSHVGVGIRSYLTESFLFRAEYKNYVIFTSQDENKEIDEWQLGFAVFF